jgi:hypothetical protein
MATALIIAACKPEEGGSSLLSANLSELQGAVEMKQTGEQDFSPAQSDSTLDVNGQIRTGDDGKARLDLSTGTIVRVSPSSLFTLVANEEVDDGLATNVKLELGRIFVILSGGSVEVDTPSGVASVRGSHMMVEVDPITNNVLVTCLTGNCRASNQAGTVDFTAGEKTILFTFDPETGQFLPPTVEPMSDEDYQKWLEAHPESAAIINQAIAAMTAMAATEPPATQAPPTEPPATEPPVTEAPLGGSSDSGEAACFGLLEPDDGSDFISTVNKVDFSWDEQQGAVKYVLEFTYPNGFVVQFETTETSMTRYVESMPTGGAYTWNVTAYGENGSALCTAESKSFTKEESPSWQEKKETRKEKDKDEGPPDPQPTAPPPPPTEPVCIPAPENCYCDFPCEIFLE